MTQTPTPEPAVQPAETAAPAASDVFTDDDHGTLRSAAMPLPKAQAAITPIARLRASSMISPRVMSSGATGARQAPSLPVLERTRWMLHGAPGVPRRMAVCFRPIADSEDRSLPPRVGASKAALGCLAPFREFLLVPASHRCAI